MFLEHLWKSHRGLSATLDSLNQVLFCAPKVYPSWCLCVLSFFLQADVWGLFHLFHKLAALSQIRDGSLPWPYLHIYRRKCHENTLWKIRAEQASNCQGHVLGWLYKWGWGCSRWAWGGVRWGSGMVPHFPGDISGRWGDAELELHPGHLWNKPIVMSVQDLETGQEWERWE